MDYLNSLTDPEQRRMAMSAMGIKPQMMFDPLAANARQQAQYIINNATDGQRKSAGFATRLFNGMDRVNSVSGNIDQNRAGEIVARLGNGTIGNFAMSPDEQLYANALTDLVSGIVRKESGAAVTEQEWSNAFAQYVPTLSDSPALISQKMNLLEQSAQLAAAEAGGITDAYEFMFDGSRAEHEQPTTPPPADTQPTPPPTGIPKEGDVVDGYQFLGGDPNNPSRWKEV
jgi:hypothetical protein